MFHYVKGTSLHDELGTLASADREKMIVTAAQFLARFHLATENFMVEADDLFYLRYDGPLEKDGMCHNDFAPYNLTFQNFAAVGLIDFDTLCPAPREWDIAYALYRFIVIDVTNTANYKRQIKLFLDAYGYKKTTDFSLLIIERLEALIALIQMEVKKGHPSFIQMVEEGHLEFYRAEIVRIKALELA